MGALFLYHKNFRKTISSMRSQINQNHLTYIQANGGIYFGKQDNEIYVDA